MSNRRTCKTCHKEKPLTAFHRSGKTTEGKTRFRRECTTCANKKRVQRYQKQVKKHCDEKNTQRYEIVKGHPSLVQIKMTTWDQHTETLEDVLSDYLESFYEVI